MCVVARMTDVLIVGAGPAGSFLAYLLACRGVSVTIIDKAAFPRDKVCGGGLSNKTVELLPFDLAPVVQRRLIGAFLTYRNRDTVVKDLGDRGGVAVLRSEFDHWLLRNAADAGATIREATAFERVETRADGIAVTTSRGVLKARYLVGADGVFSQVRHAIFGRGVVTYAPAVEALVSVTPEHHERLGNRVLFDFGGMPHGYGWIFPKEDHLNVGVYSIYPTRSIKTALARFMSRYEILQTPLRVRFQGSAIPVTNRRQRIARENVLLVGDAAGFAESFLGEGIYFALQSATIAADALFSTFDGSPSRAYRRLIAARLQPDLTYAALSARLFYPFQRAAFLGMVRDERVNGYFAEMIAGGSRPRDCFYKALLTWPCCLWSRRLAPLAAPLL